MNHDSRLGSQTVITWLASLQPYEGLSHVTPPRKAEDPAVRARLRLDDKDPVKAAKLGFKIGDRVQVKGYAGQGSGMYSDGDQGTVISSIPWDDIIVIMDKLQRPADPPFKTNWGNGNFLALVTAPTAKFKAGDRVVYNDKALSVGNRGHYAGTVASIEGTKVRYVHGGNDRIDILDLETLLDVFWKMTKPPEPGWYISDHFQGTESFHRDGKVLSWWSGIMWHGWCGVNVPWSTKEANKRLTGHSHNTVRWLRKATDDELGIPY